ncbi:MAG TPA: molecular chaperone [Limnobacter sp.]|nr:molecular chaperone [Limnobacter sp.]
MKPKANPVHALHPWFARLLKAALCVASAAGFVVVPSLAHASVVVQGTRVVYNGGASQTEVQISNRDDFPNMVQVWVDAGDPQSSPEDHDDRFFLTPPLFRLQPHSGQALRIKYLEHDLPQDRETLFYLNVLQVPPVSAEQMESNKVLLMIRSRLKLFYRPESIHADPSTAGDALAFEVEQRDEGMVLLAKNPSPFFVTLTGVTLSSKAGGYSVESRMIAPFAQQVWLLDDPSVLEKPELVVEYQWLDDTGGGRQQKAAVQR